MRRKSEPHYHNRRYTGGRWFAANGTPGARNLTQPLPLAESLLIGTLKLQGTSNAVNATQAAALVPLWQAYAQLTSSNTAAQAEIDAVVTQIQQTMTPAQVQAITAMKLTRQDMFTEMSSLGLTNGGANGTPGFSFTPRAGGGGGGGGGGFFAAVVVAVASLAVAVVAAVVSPEPVVRLPGRPRTQPRGPAGAVCQPHTHAPDERPGLLLAEDRRVIVPWITGQSHLLHKWDCPFEESVSGNLIYWNDHLTRTGTK